MHACPATARHFRLGSSTNVELDLPRRLGNLPEAECAAFNSVQSKPERGPCRVQRPEHPTAPDRLSISVKKAQCRRAVLQACSGRFSREDRPCASHERTNERERTSGVWVWGVWPCTALSRIQEVYGLWLFKKSSNTYNQATLNICSWPFKK